MGILGYQGCIEPHEAIFKSLGVNCIRVRTQEELAQVDRLILPGGESTTMMHLLATNELFEPLAARLASGMPVFGTCAGMILLAAEVLDGRAGQRSFAAIDIAVRRNGYGRQVDSFEDDLDVVGLDEPFHVVFIRAPKVERIGDDVEVLARHRGVPVLARQGNVLVASFHPELTDDLRLHGLFVSLVHHALPAAAAS